MGEQVLPVENNVLESAQDDAAQAQDNASDLSEILDQTVSDQTEGAQPAADQPTAAQPPKEPGWIKQRVESAVQKQLAQAVADAEARIRAQYEAQMQPLRDSIIEREAQDLVDSGQIKDKNMALSYARMKHGLPSEAAQNVPAQRPAEAANQAQPRDEKGRFTTSENENVQQRATMLAAQAKAIMAAGGPDVMKAYREDENVRNRILSGEADFADIAEQMRSGRTAPTPVRAANGQTVEASSISSMTDEQFDKLNAMLRRGRRFKT